METTIIQDGLVLQGGRILGRLERWDIPGVLGRRCHSCDRLIPVPNWEVHQFTCHTVGWGRYRCPIADFKAPATTRRRPSVDFVAELLPLLGKK